MKSNAMIIGTYDCRINSDEFDMSEPDYLPSWCWPVCIVVQQWINRRYGFRGFCVTPPVIPQ